MALLFQHALYAMGAVLFMLGAAYLLLNMSASEKEMGFFDALSFSFTAVCAAVFSGVMMGVGSALVIDGLLQRLSRRLHRIGIALFLGLLSAAMGMLSVADASSATFLSFVAFISCSIFALCMILSSSVIGFSGLLAKYLSSK